MLVFIRTGFEMNVGVVILRLQEGRDCSGILADIDDLILNSKNPVTDRSISRYEYSITSNLRNLLSPSSDSTSLTCKHSLELTMNFLL